MSWDDVTLGDVLTLQRGHDLPVGKRQPGPYPVVASTGIAGYHCEAAVKGPGVVIGRSGSIGGGQYLDQDFWPLNTTLWVKDFKGNNPTFCYYLLKSIDFSTFNVGSGVPTLNRNHIHPLPVRLPDRKTQDGIAATLAALDDKIANNRALAADLEAMARAIFKSWFVDFDPVKAKMEGRAPAGMDADTAALFPDEFVESELGLIPKGWEVKRIEDIISRQSVGKKFSNKTVKSTGKVPVLDQGKSGIIGYHDEEPGVQASPDDPIVVFANHTCLQRLVMHDFSAIQNVLPFRGKELDVYFVHHFAWGKQHFQEYKGHWPDLMLHQGVVPSNVLANEFSALVAPMHKTAFALQQENLELGELRDQLLPRLISGKLRATHEGGCLEGAMK